jgi:peroxiredoxin
MNKKFGFAFLIISSLGLYSCISWVPNAYYYGIKEGGFAKSLKQKSKHPKLGKPFELIFTSLDGKKIDTTQMKGKVILLDFYASWLPPYIRNIERMKNIYHSYQSKNFQLIGISIDTNQTKLKEFVSNHEIKWPQYFDGRGWENQVLKDNNVTKVQSVWIINKEGLVVDTNALSGIDEKMNKYLSK